MSVKGRVGGFWSGPGGGREVLLMSYPLILSNLSFTLQTFIDRLFLTWYSPDAVAGAMTGLFTVWIVMGLFLGTGEFVNTFVSQYHGAGRSERIGPAVWQGIYFAAAAGVVLVALTPFLDPIFTLSGHDPRVREYELTYSSILAYGAFPIVLMATLSTFFSGRGQTLIVLVVEVIATLINVGLDYMWIFGHAGFPRMGVAGAAYATICSQAAGALIFFALMVRRENRAAYRTLSGYGFESGLFGRLLRYGLPTGLQYTGEIFAFSIFMIIIGRIGTNELAATGIAFSLNMIVFMPMIGMGIGVSTLVGRYLGQERPDVAERSGRSALVMCMLYMSACGAAYVFAPHFLLSPFGAGADPVAFQGVEPIAAVLLRFVALYSIFDMMTIIGASALRGAGDTLWPFATSVTLSWVLMLIPASVACMVFGMGVLAAWTAATAYIVVLGLLVLQRFRNGSWKHKRVIEPHVPELDGGDVIGVPGGRSESDLIDTAGRE